jgi:hypothetical protein
VNLLWANELDVPGRSSGLRSPAAPLSTLPPATLCHEAAPRRCRLHLMSRSSPVEPRNKCLVRAIKIKATKFNKLVRPMEGLRFLEVHLLGELGVGLRRRRGRRGQVVPTCSTTTDKRTMTQTQADQAHAKPPQTASVCTMVCKTECDVDRLSIKSSQVSLVHWYRKAWIP